MRGIMNKIIGIMAATSEGVIGKDAQLPWNYPEELDHFRHITKGHITVMGHKTFETLPPQFFADRIPIVFSQNHFLEKTPPHKVVRNLEEFLSFSSTFSQKKIFMIGGAQIAHLFLRKNLISEFFLTRIHKSYEGDTHLDLRFFEGWNEDLMTSTLKYTIFRLQNPKRRTHDFFKYSQPASR